MRRLGLVLVSVVRRYSHVIFEYSHLVMSFLYLSAVTFPAVHMVPNNCNLLCIFLCWSKFKFDCTFAYTCNFTVCCILWSTCLTFCVSLMCCISPTATVLATYNSHCILCVRRNLFFFSFYQSMCHHTTWFLWQHILLTVAVLSDIQLLCMCFLQLMFAAIIELLWADMMWCLCVYVISCEL